MGLMRERSSASPFHFKIPIRPRQVLSIVRPRRNLWGIGVLSVCYLMLLDRFKRLEGSERIRASGTTGRRWSGTKFDVGSAHGKSQIKSILATTLISIPRYYCYKWTAKGDNGGWNQLQYSWARYEQEWCSYCHHSDWKTWLPFPRLSK